MNFTLNISRDGLDAVLSPCGELDLSSEPQWLAGLAELVAGRPDRINIDLRNVTFIDSAGLNLLVITSLVAGDSGIATRLIGTPEHVQRRLECTEPRPQRDV